VQPGHRERRVQVDRDLVVIDRGRAVAGAAVAAIAAVALAAVRRRNSRS